MSDDATADAARRAWRAMSDLVLDADRRTAVTEALGLSFARTRALRRLVDQPLTLRELAARLGADPPYATLIVDDLQERGLVQRTPHPDDRRAKLVQLTAAGRAAAVRAREILDQPPPALRALPPDEVASLLRVLERLQQLAADGGD
ncbi:Transcriptional regulator MarR family [Patulibacter medicamentivorans]|uniref:Transcriptional regulator MarR family n=1 Tax=Patulibacter medicamentivorans TaxID=1097667 RepID=H0DZS2_9ACTN|nr:MarR family transcriptional regulator [Patulibacter medicamentivorans]EHN13026.1 Transcriptional regulator MarR family [Patulibacter medicamentivorans]